MQNGMSALPPKAEMNWRQLMRVEDITGSESKTFGPTRLHQSYIAVFDLVFCEWAFLVAWFYGYMKITLGFSCSTYERDPWKQGGTGVGPVHISPRSPTRRPSVSN